jgi:serine/threonine protein kinase
MEVEIGRILTSKGVSYRIDRLLGAGSFGSVAKCTVVQVDSAVFRAPLCPRPGACNEAPLRIGDIVAVKIAKDSPVFRAQASVEVRVLSSLHQRAVQDAAASGIIPLGSGNLVRVLDHFSVPGEMICVVMEFLPMTLLDVLGRGAYTGLPLNTVRIITRQIFTALHFVHVHGLCHGDVKPGTMC